MGDDLASAPKNHDTLLQAWKRSGLGVRNGILHLLGDGNLRSDLEDLAGDDASIVFHGVRSDVKSWLVAGDCYVMPSRWEGLPIAALEALGTGLPCIFSDIPPLRGIEAPRAIWCDPSDVESLARALLEFATKPDYPARSEVEEGRRRFAIETTADAYLDTYAQLLDRHR
jgi:glycosyltransferase involved in cell wall biosynthesis